MLNLEYIPIYYNQPQSQRLKASLAPISVMVYPTAFQCRTEHDPVMMKIQILLIKTPLIVHTAALVQTRISFLESTRSRVVRVHELLLCH